jgi:CelD/BcsL family acetyltransferase involved in cellulose biosynthesis
MAKITFDWLTNDSLDGIETVWRDLQNRCTNATIFQTFEWVSVWWNRYKNNDDQLLIGILKEDDTVEAVFPFFVKTRSTILGTFRIAQFLGIEEVAPSSMDILITKRGLELLSKHFAKLTSDWQKHADLLDLAPVRLGSYVLKLLNQDSDTASSMHQCDVEEAPVLAAPGSFERWLGSLGSSTRRDIRRKRNYLATQANVKINHYDKAKDVERGLKKLADLNIKRLSQLGKCGGFMLPRFEEFHQKFAAELASQGRAHLFELTLGEKVLSAAIVYSLGKAWYAYQTGMDPEYLHLAPGAVLDSSVLEYIFDKTDATHVDMGLGHQEYKLRFGGIPQKAYRLRLPAHTWRGSILKIALIAKRRKTAITIAKSHAGVPQPCN